MTRRSTMCRVRSLRARCSVRMWLRAASSSSDAACAIAELGRARRRERSAPRRRR